MKMTEEQKNYHRVHLWLRWNFGRASFCENLHCRRTSTRFQWALIKGKVYEKKVENFLMLCSPCHIEYDGTMKKLQENNKKPVVAIKGNKKIYFDCILEASKTLKVLNTGISNCLTNKAHTAGGYIWKYV